MVVIADQFVTPARSICSAAHSRSQRDSNTKVAAMWSGAFMQACMPVTWNIGNADSTTVSSTVPRQYMYGIVVACTLACVCMQDRKSTRLNSSHLVISYAVFCLKKKKK